MRLVLRRAGEAKGLLLAAGAAALVAVALVTGLVIYNAQVLEAGKRAIVDGASAEEQSLLVTGSVPAGAYPARDAAVRSAFTDGLGGLPATTLGARAGTGRQLTGNLGEYALPDGKLLFASMVVLDDLSSYADLRAGSWPQSGGDPLQVALPQPVADRLGVGVGDRIPLLDRATDRASDVTVAGVWQPRNLRDPYWRLVPEVTGGNVTSTTIGPFVLHSDDFARVFTGTTSAAWLVDPELDAASVAQIRDVWREAAAIAERLPEEAGFGSSAQTSVRLDRLLDRLTRADLVGRSALLTPVLLLVVLGGYALVLIAALLGEDRRAQNALLRARGAARRQLAGLAAREAALVVLPVAVAAPLLATQVLGYAERKVEALAELGLDPRPTAAGWLVAGAAAVGCLLALLVPALRRGGTYIEDLASRSRPNRLAAAQRASADLALVGLALLAWVQLRQYSSPLAGDAGIDPLLAAAPILGVLAGAVIALRLLPPATRYGERFVTPKPWTAAVLGVWQAGRRPHAGPVLLLALAVGASTLAWSLITTWHGSLMDQASHRVGADLRVVEQDFFAPPTRAAQVAALPGVQTALPAWRDQIRVGAQDMAATMVALDAAAAAQVVRLNERLVDGVPGALFERLADARVAAPGADLPAGTRRISGMIRALATHARHIEEVRTELLLSTDDGQIYPVSIATTPSDGTATRFAVDLPDSAGRPLRLAGFRVDAPQADPTPYAFHVTQLQAVGADGTEVPVDLDVGRWQSVNHQAKDIPAKVLSPAGLSVEYQVLPFSIVRHHPAAPVPALVTPHVLAELDVRVGQEARLTLPSGPMNVTIVGVVDAVPTVEGAPAVLLDLPSAATALLHQSGHTRPVSEWWIAVEPGRQAATAKAADELLGVTVLDRFVLAAEANGDPYWAGARTGLLVAALGAALLALVGLTVDVGATARRRLSELAVLHTLGATPRLLARALIVEQAFLAGIGVTVGLVIGAGVGAAMAPLVILTPSGHRPVPSPDFDLAGMAVGVTAASLFAVALALSGFIALTLRQRVAATQLRIGADR
ncbi:MAG TPA: FtsX-like permease family protein [Micromonosporaceae bacterium]|nr:FtsX-like permease family protein [Micromonosporaceae bacterium]